MSNSNEALRNDIENKNKLGLIACQNCLNTLNNSYGWDPANRTNLFLLFSRSTRISKKKSEFCFYKLYCLWSIFANFHYLDFIESLGKMGRNNRTCPWEWF